MPKAPPSNVSLSLHKPQKSVAANVYLHDFSRIKAEVDPKTAETMPESPRWVRITR